MDYLHHLKQAYDIDIINKHTLFFEKMSAQLAMVGEGVGTQTQVCLTSAVLSFHYLPFLLELTSGYKNAMFLLGNFLHRLSSYHNSTFHSWMYKIKSQS